MSTRIAALRARFRLIVLCYVLAAIFVTAAPSVVRAVEPTGLPPDAVDWVCLTDDDLADVFAPLAAHRERQGLSTRIVTTDQVAAWMVALPDLPTRIRTFSRCRGSWPRGWCSSTTTSPRAGRRTRW